MISSKGYENKFSEKLLSCVNVGDCVWDVGANVGLYTSEFSKRVGDKGEVRAIEPIEATYRILIEQNKHLPNVHFHKLALGTTYANVTMTSDANASVTNQITYDLNKDGLETVQMQTADMLAKDCNSFPNIIKIDVEGFEGDVIAGMKEILSSSAIRVIGIELHFAEIKKLEKLNDVEFITSTLMKHGFTITWTDFSHIVAQK